MAKKQEGGRWTERVDEDDGQGKVFDILSVRGRGGLLQFLSLLVDAVNLFVRSQ